MPFLKQRSAVSIAWHAAKDTESSAFSSSLLAARLVVRNIVDGHFLRRPTEPQMQGAVVASGRPKVPRHIISEVATWKTAANRWLRLCYSSRCSFFSVLMGLVPLLAGTTARAESIEQFYQSSLDTSAGTRVLTF